MTSPWAPVETRTTLKGYIDDIRFYERALLLSDAAKLYKLEEPKAPEEPETLKPTFRSHPSHVTVAVGDACFLYQKSTASPIQLSNGRSWPVANG